MAKKGYDSIMQPFGQSPEGQRRSRIQPGDRLADGTVYHPANSTARWEDEIRKLNTQIEFLETKKAQYQAKIDELKPKPKPKPKRKSAASKKEETKEE